MGIVRLDLYRQQKQRQYMRRYRHRLDQFIRLRIHSGVGQGLLITANSLLNGSSSDREHVWDYSEIRDLIVDQISQCFAGEIYEELRQQFWFDETYVTRDMVAERCYSQMILGQAAIAAD